VDVFELYRQDLLRRDIEPATRERYTVVAGSFRSWLAGREPSTALAEDFLAHLREQGYRQRSILLYYHVVRQVLALKGETLELRLRKPRDLPNWYDGGGYRAPPDPSGDGAEGADAGDAEKELCPGPVPLPCGAEAG